MHDYELVIRDSGQRQWSETVISDEASENDLAVPQVCVVLFTIEYVTRLICVPNSPWAVSSGLGLRRHMGLALGCALPTACIRYGCLVQLGLGLG